MKPVSSIIFDLGGVVFDIDYNRITESFRNLGLDSFDSLYTQMKQDRLFDDLEMGLITPGDFRKRIQAASGNTITEIQVDAAWNAILIGLPEENVNFLFALKKKYRLFLLSNTNEIHEKAFKSMIEDQYGEYVLARIFEKIYLSHRMHQRKPDPEIFRRVLRENGLNADETLFIDDSLQHIKGAGKAGLQTLWLTGGKKITELVL
ncbi:MAG: HAD family phosphatase [Bacteroidia bacterium]|nr:HAD family phosphatase [Bacteroidia bacterium]